MKDDETRVVTLIWDHLPVPETHLEGLVIYARRYDPPPGGISLPAYLDAHGETIRNAYITFVHDIGQHQVGTKSVAEHFADPEGFSYWWMSQIAEKSPFKSPRIYDCLRIMAMEHMIRSEKINCQSFNLCGGDPKIAQTLSAFCSHNRVAFRHTPITKKKQTGLATRLHASLPWRLKGILSLRHWARRWLLRSLSAPQWHPKPHGLLFVSYFFNIDGNKAGKGEFHSHQWEKLPEILRREGWRLNWLHHMLLLPGIRSVSQARNIVQRFNADSQNQGCHSFIESEIGFKLFIGALVEWLRLGQKANALRPHVSFSPKGSHLDFQYLLKDDWETSFNGSIALGNCIWRRLFDQTISAMPNQAAGFYLWENQGWECAFVHSWRRYQSAPLIGIPHATIAYWHLNNFDDPKTINASGAHASKPLPEMLAVNGPIAWHNFQESGYPLERMVPVEAARFMHLLQGKRRVSSSKRDPQHKLKILMLGDFSREQSRAMGECLKQAVSAWGGSMELTVKPHPITLLDRNDLPGIEFTLSDRPLGEILQRFDLAFASNSTSAALDAWLHGLPVAVFLDDSSLNHSPMRNTPGSCFVCNGNQLARILSDGVDHPPMAVNDFFWLDVTMRRWRELIKEVADIA